MPSSVRYRCRRCRVTRKGRPGLESCPECGEHLIVLTSGKRATSDNTSKRNAEYLKRSR